MTTDDTQTQPGPPPPGPAPTGGYPPISTLRRSRTDRHISGVAGGLGRYAGVDPLVFRILFVVLALFGGTGLLLYALAWLLIPLEGEQQSEGQRLFDGSQKSSMKTVVALVVVLVLGLAGVAAMLDTGPGVGGLGALVVIGVIIALLLNRGQRPTPFAQAPGSPTYGPVPPEPGAYGQTPGTAYAPTAPAFGPPPPPYTSHTQPLPPPPGPPKERSVLGRVTFYAALIVVGVMVGWNTVSDDDFRVVAILASALAVVATGLLVGAYAGRARGLIVLGIVLSVVTSAVAASDDHFRGGVGERRWAPTTATAAERPFRLGVGDAELDLTGLPSGSRVDVQARLGVGELHVIVPLDSRVVVQGDVGAGTMRLFDGDPLDGTDLHDSVTSIGPPGVSPSGTQITIDAEVGLGELEVRR
ncbi:MAG: PspC domain-containing protein [Actinomycetes bacterium]